MGNAVASAVFVAAWGWFLYQGVIDPLGGINSLWPIFGVANQLLAVIAFALGTTVVIKMGRARYAWVTLLPLGWLLTVTMSAGWMKIFSADPRLGFLSAARALRVQIMAGPPSAKLVQLQRLVFNNEVNAAITGLFLILVALVVVICAREWALLLTKRRLSILREEPYVAVDAVKA